MNQLSLTVTEGRKSSLKKGMGKNQVVLPSLSELMGFCIGTPISIISLMVAVMLVMLVFIFFQEPARRLRSLTGAIQVRRGNLAESTIS